jgi:hypothetical protein
MSETVTDLTVVGAPAPGSVSVDEVEKIAQELGLVAVNADKMRKIERLGIGVEGMGVVRCGKGWMLTTQLALSACMQKVKERMDKGDLSDETLRSLSYTTGYLASKMSQAVKVGVDIDDSGRTVREEADKKRRSSFIPGAVVSQHNYYGPVTVAPPAIEVGKE